MADRSFADKIGSDDLTPRRLMEALKKIPEEYLDDQIHINQHDCLELFMVIDDAEEARAKWRRGDPDYLIFLELK